MRSLTVEQVESLEALPGLLRAANRRPQWHRPKGWAPHLWCLQVQRGDAIFPFYGNSPEKAAREAVAALDGHLKVTEEEDDAFIEGEEER